MWAQQSREESPGRIGHPPRVERITSNSHPITDSEADRPPPKRRQRWTVRLLAGLGFIAVLPRIGFLLSTRGDIRSVKTAPSLPVAMVLGAGLRFDGKPSDVLQARVNTAVSLYKAGKVRVLLMSGDNSLAEYDEVSAMKKAAVALGVPSEHVLLDFAGFRTLDSCVRLRKVFGQTEAVIVSQGFHLPRAIHLCRWAGVAATGVEAPDPRTRPRRIFSGTREIAASFQAWLDAHVLDRGPKFLGEPIDIDNPPADALEQPPHATPTS